MTSPPPLVLRLLRSLHEATKDSPQPAWVSLDSLQLRVDRIRLSQAVVLAGLSGWLQLSGSPPKDVAITAAGIAQLEGKSE
jgi:hypothetical protein